MVNLEGLTAMRSVMMTCGNDQSEQAPDKIFPAAHRAISAIHHPPPTIQKIVCR
jgi:hypothetical protein